jgi:predicted amidophosphoribosyltransferase
MNSFLICPRCDAVFTSKKNYCDKCKFRYSKFADENGHFWYSFPISDQLHFIYVNINENISIISKFDCQKIYIEYVEVARIKYKLSPKMTQEEFDKYLVLL